MAGGRMWRVTLGAIGSTLEVFTPVWAYTRVYSQRFQSDDNKCRWIEDEFPLPRGVQRLGHAMLTSGLYVMYHGTSRENAQSIWSQGFYPSKGGMLGPGVYLSRDLLKASRYPTHLPESQRVVLRVIADVGKVIAITYQGHPLQETWHDNGYDTAWVPPNCGMVSSGLEENCIWDPKRILIHSRPTISPQMTQYHLTPQ